MTRKTNPVETPEGEALPAETPSPVARQRATYQTGHGGSVTIDPPPAAESTEETIHAD